MTVEPGTFGTLRELNRLRVVDALRRAGTASRSDLARMTGISRTTVATLVSDLQARGLIVEQSDGRAEPTGRGRPPVLLRLDAAAGSALGIDFGHRHVRVAVADLSSAVLAEQVVELDVDSVPDEAPRRRRRLAAAVLAEAGVDRERVIGAGMALSGPIDRHRGVVGSTVLPGWAGIQAGEELSAQARDPGRAGQRRQPRRPRGGLVRRGPRLHRRRLRDDVRGDRRRARARRPPLPRRPGIAGELGHIQVRTTAAVCRCGNRGCLETVAVDRGAAQLLRRRHGPDLTLRRSAGARRRRRPGRAARRQRRRPGGGPGRRRPLQLPQPGRDRRRRRPQPAGDALLDGVREEIDRYSLPSVAEAVEVVGPACSASAPRSSARSRSSSPTRTACAPPAWRRSAPAARAAERGYSRADG